MSSKRVKEGKCHEFNNKEPFYIKQRRMALNRLKESMKPLLDDNNTSEQKKSSVFKNDLDTTSSSETDPEGKFAQSHTSRERTKLDKHNLKKDRRSSYINVRNDKSKRIESDSESSDTEDNINDKRAERRDRRILMLKLKEKNLNTLHRDDTGSSSSKEFQKSKISHVGSNVMKKLARSQKQNRMTSTDSNSESVNEKIATEKLSDKQNIFFKSGINKIMNKMKELCSEYELQVDNIKWKHLKKDMRNYDSTEKVYKKLKTVIESMKEELDVQDKKLINFYEDWEKNCRSENTEHEDSSPSEAEESKTAVNEKESEKLKNVSQVSPIVSECDDEIFSGNEAQATLGKNDKNKIENLPTIAEISMNDDSDQVDASPIVANRTIRDKILPVKTDLTEQTKLAEETGDQKETSQECPASDILSLNVSVDDIFDETTIENVSPSPKIKDESDNGSETDVTLNKNGSDSMINERKRKRNNSSDTVEGLEKSREKEMDSFSNTLDEEERAKKALLTSDSDTPPITLINDITTTVESSENDNIKETDATETMKPDKKRKKYNNRQNESEDKSPEDLTKIMEAESLAVRMLLESNSDDSLSHSEKPIFKKSLKQKLNSTGSSEDSSSDDDSNLNGEKQNSSKEGQKKNERPSSSIEKQDNSSKDSNSNIDSESSIGKRYSLRKKNAENKKDSTSLKMLVNNKMKNSIESDKIISCKVVLERLPKSVLNKHNNTLEKSREYLESKEFRSLIRVDNLGRNTRSKSLTRSSNITQLCRNSKSKSKEAEETLLDHLKRIEEGNFDEAVGNDAVSDPENDNTVMKTDTTMQSNEDLIKQADAVTKKMLLYSSDSDAPIEKKVSSESDEEKNMNKSGKPVEKPIAKSTQEDSDKENDEEREKSRWRRHKLLTMKLTSDSDSDVARQKWVKKQEKLAETAKNDQAEDSEKNNDSIMKRKPRTRRKIMVSDDSDVKSDPDSNSSVELLENKSSDSDSSVGKRKKGNKRKMQKSSDSDSMTVKKKTKPKRKRIKNMSSDSDAESDDQMTNSQGTPGKKGRKNIRKVMEEELVADDTKLAAKAEEERLKRIAERQKVYNEMYEARLASEEKVDKLVLDFDPDTKKELVTVHEKLVKRLKPHQAEGIKFMWDACFESLERIKTSPGSGCIIAHCMGLGKTLQVIALVYTLLTHEQTGVKTVLIVSPLNTVLNWLNEFNLWLKDLDDYNDVDVYEMTKLKKNVERVYQLQHWHESGGVMIIGYEMFRNLSANNNRMRKKMREDTLRYLIDPGPDLIVCDEGHLLKNEDTALSKSIKRIKTLRRIVLTGTPLQNNLNEYHCMVQFVKPSLLGTKAEFSNRFVNPITNGQFDDSTEYDVKLMKKRAYVLNKMLKGCVQRCDYSVLTPFLPPKQEYVIFVSLTETQINLYRYYLNHLARKGRYTATLFADFQALQRIWTHPLVLRMNSEKIEKLNEKKLDSESEGSLKDFIDDSDTESGKSSSSSSSVYIEDDDAAPNAGKSQNKTSKRGTRNTPAIDVPEETEEPEKKEEEWWLQFVKPEDLEDMRVSAKLMLLFGILKECEQIGDKVLVFSQSLYSLTLIERFLEKIDDSTQNNSTSELIAGHTGSWSLGLDYFRLDGQTNAENRSAWCKIFNRPTNTRGRLFLISTRAGGLGINLTAANRVIIFDASWNPSHDVQSIFRVYRFGQKKPCYVYRFLATGTMEEKIYNRQVTKLSLSCRVVDEQQIERHYSNNDLSELYTFEPKTEDNQTLNLPKDRLLAEIFLKYKNYVKNYHEHDSLLENKTEEELNEEERKQAWTEYEEEKKGKPKVLPTFAMQGAYTQNPLMNNQYTPIPQMNLATDYSNLRELLQKDYPNATPEMQQMLTSRALAEMYNYWEKQTMNNVTKQLLEQNQNTNLRAVISNPVALNRVNYVMPNVNANMSNQPNRTTSRQADDDDVIEVTSTSTVNNINKNQEE
ncbi:transcriptional regulator ATRX homolog isoform X2 [Ceratina calcarata]|uniref:Transcriptional regulator ATRX homolog isoform X2 n=1 Tax=Ceratina calcarata TaxID=156304 RepID=A0AAJ7IRT3_9HYME|nr:transcriptional regulator ATRX homolog isoform X2 [Ceratina calcarata]